MPRVLVKEPIAEAGVELLRSSFDVDVDVEMAAEDLPDRIGDYDALIVRSATRVTDELLAHAPRLKVIGRAGTGVDNVDVPAATRRGIIVANAPGSNMVSAAEHAVGLLLAMARNIPQAHAALKEGRWERSRFGGIEVCGKTLGVLGFGRIGQLVASRARGLGMHVIAHDPFVSPERFRETQVMQAGLDELLAASDFITLHAPLTPETEHLDPCRDDRQDAPRRADRERRPRRPGRPRRAGGRPAERARRGRGARRVPGRAVHVRPRSSSWTTSC